MSAKKENGFTLLEVLVAIILFSFVFLLFGAFFVNSFTASNKQDSQAVAINIARYLAEEWKNGQPCAKPLTPPQQTYRCNEITINDRQYFPVVHLDQLDPIDIITVEIYSTGYESDQIRPLTAVHVGMPRRTP